MITDADVEFYRTHGYLHVKSLFTADEVEGMRGAIAGILARAEASEHDHNHTWNGEYLPEEERKKLVLKGFHDVHFHDAAFTRAAVHPRMAEVLSRLIGPNVELHHSKMLVKPPENGAVFPMHQDHPYFPHTLHSMLAASVHLDDTDLENGCLHVVPGSHQAGPLPHQGAHYLDPAEYPLESALPLPAKAGDVLFFTYLTVHGSTPNRSNRVRRNVLFQYRDPADRPVEKMHVNWGQGLMVCGADPVFRSYDPKAMV